MAKKGGNRMKVKIEGLSELAKIPGWLEHGQRQFLDTAAQRVAAKIASGAPGGASGSVGRATKGHAISSTKAEITVNHPGARVLEEGGTIKPKKKALRFVVGGQVVFVRRSSRRRQGSAGAPPGAVFIPARRFAKKGLRSRGRIVREAYQEAFDNLAENR